LKGVVILAVVDLLGDGWNDERTRAVEKVEQFDELVTLGSSLCKEMLVISSR
jgi:hypothetical protein